VILEALSNASGVSGDEGEVRGLIRREIADHVDRLETDALGNLFSVKQTRRGERGPRVMVAAHMDEVGLMVVGHEERGQLRFRTVGGIDVRLLPAKTFLVGNEKRPGVVGMKPLHLLTPEARKETVKLKDLFLDIGASTAEEAKRLAPVGSYAVFATTFERYGRTVIKGKAFDDRVGCAVLVEIAKAHQSIPVSLAFTVQEEVGLRGARVAAERLRPDIGIVIEGTAAADFPRRKDVGTTPRLGEGPTVTTMDRTVICDPGLVALIREIAEQEGIPLQTKRPMVGGTDGGRIAVAGGGARVAVISVPCRYLHGPASLASLHDIRHAAELVALLLERLARPGWRQAVHRAGHRRSAR